MTLIIAIANLEWSVLISDRRCSFDGIIVDNDLNKTATLTIKNARLMYGFTGLAKSGEFTTNEWIAKAITDCAPPDHDAGKTLLRLADLATETFRLHRSLHTLPKKRKLLTILFSGYLNDDRPIGLAELSNRDALNPNMACDVFTCRFRQHPSLGYGDAKVWFSAGAKWAMRPTDIDRLSEIAVSSTSSRAAIFSAVKVMRTIARRPTAARTIGEDMMSIAMKREGGGFESTFHSATSRNSTFFPAIVYATPKIRAAITNIELSSPNQRMSGPVPPKSLPCECGSGLKQRKCCSRRYMKLMRKREGKSQIDSSTARATLIRGG